MSKYHILFTLAFVTLAGFVEIQKFNNKMESRFTTLTLAVDDLEKSYKFYHEGLGLPSKGIIGKEFEHGEVAFFDLPHRMKLALYSRENLAWDAKVVKQNSSATEFSIGYNVRNKEEV